ncbi:transposase [Pseudomonas serbica]
MRQRSSYPKPFKSQVVQECLQPGAAISSVAISHGINANVIRKWIPLYRDLFATSLPAFVQVKAAVKRPASAVPASMHATSCKTERANSSAMILAATSPASNSA